jgi:hypothetical protein
METRLQPLMRRVLNIAALQRALISQPGVPNFSRSLREVGISIARSGHSCLLPLTLILTLIGKGTSSTRAEPTPQKGTRLQAAEVRRSPICRWRPTRNPERDAIVESHPPKNEGCATPRNGRIARENCQPLPGIARVVDDKSRVHSLSGPALFRGRNVLCPDFAI